MECKTTSEGFELLDPTTEPLLSFFPPGFKAAITLTTTTVAATDLIVLQFENTYLILNFWLFIKKLRDAESQGGSKPQRLSCESNVPTT